MAPLAASAKQRGAQVAHDAIERYGPKLEDALERVSPAIDAARGKMHDDVLPRLSDALSAAAGNPVVAEATSRAQAVAAAAKGELVVPPKKKKSRWIKRLAIVAAIGGVVVVVARRLMGKADSDWQAARPTAPYSPPKSEQAATPEAVVDDTAATNGQVTADASDDPQAGTTAHLADADANAEPAVDDVTAEAEAAVGRAPAIRQCRRIGELSPPISCRLRRRPTSRSPARLSSRPSRTRATARADDEAEVRGRGSLCRQRPTRGLQHQGQ